MNVYDRIKDEVNERLEQIILNIDEYDMEKILDCFEDFSVRKWDYGHVKGFVKNLKGKPELTNENRKLVNEIEKLQDEIREIAKNSNETAIIGNIWDELNGFADYKIEVFANELDALLQEEFGVELLIYGRSGGWWGIKLKDAINLVREDVYDIIKDRMGEIIPLINEEIVDYMKEVDEDDEVNMWDIIEKVTDKVISRISETEFLNWNRLEEFIKFFDDKVYTAIKQFNKELNNWLKERKLEALEELRRLEKAMGKIAVNQ